MTTVHTVLKNKGGEVVTISPDATISDAARELADRRIGALVVSGDGQSVEGILSERDVVRQIAGYGAEVLMLRVRVVMTRNVMTCAPHFQVNEVMDVMTRKRIRHLPVVEQGGRLVGMISIGDAVKCRLEEMRLEANVMRDYAIARA